VPRADLVAAVRRILDPRAEPMPATPARPPRRGRAALLAPFRAAGAQPVEADILQPAETLLDLYGEDIRARAYVTADPLRGEMMLRPDFTVPVVQMHMAHGAEPARYCLHGRGVPQAGASRPARVEYMQVGYEVFDRDDPAAADAEVFALFAEPLAPLGAARGHGRYRHLMAAVRG
jgi:ATP phosphoribosyltransferase regulatory subunit HisZ